MRLSELQYKEIVNLEIGWDKIERIGEDVILVKI